MGFDPSKFQAPPYIFFLHSPLASSFTESTHLTSFWHCSKDTSFEKEQRSGVWRKERKSSFAFNGIGLDGNQKKVTPITFPPYISLLIL
jgi:hypothetical protein